MYHVSNELWKHELKFGRTRNAIGTKASGGCFHKQLDCKLEISIVLPRQLSRIEFESE